MPYFIRISQHDQVETDIRRGFSSYMGEFDLEEAAFQHLGMDAWDMSEAQMIAELDYTGWYEGADGWWRCKHHDGLSCHLIGDCLTNESIAETIEVLGTSIGTGNSHEAMYGNVTWVASIDKTTHIFYADNYDLV